MFAPPQPPVQDLIQDLAAAVRQLDQRVSALEAQPPPPAPGPWRTGAGTGHGWAGRSVRWKLWVPEDLIDVLKQVAAEQGCHPSQLVQEILWHALHDR